MQVKVKFIAPIKPVEPEITVQLNEGDTLEQLVRDLEQKLGPGIKDNLYYKNSNRPYVFFWVNGQRGTPGMILEDGAEVVILPPIDGG